ncbi:MAG: hypothetical protein A2010_18715 [Nitrospirae bacterium GWD2_57_9]|nr:MAG: hypothetical protein A2010_18715 [Nitrospirae bacterium GWD2_57_9]
MEHGFRGGFSMAVKKFIEIGGVLVNPEIFSRPYTCDVEGYDCKSQCCYRACIVPEQEVKKVEAHFDEILSYLGPENRDVLKKNGTILADCEKQCPKGCEIHEDEAQAIKRAFGGQDFRCVLIHDKTCSLVYTNKEGMRYCAVHTFALDKDLVWEEFKFADCVQYPLSFYMTEDGKQVLSIQDTPYLDHIPCMQKPKGDPMYKSLKKTIETFLGKDFYNQLASHADKRAK